MEYLKNRLLERGTWAAIGITIAGGALLPTPYSWLAIAVGVVGALVPTP